MQVQGYFSLQGQTWPTFHVTDIPTTDTLLTHPRFKIPQNFPTNWKTNYRWSLWASIGAWTEVTVCSLTGKRVQWTEFLLFRHAGQTIVLAGAEGGQMWGSHETNILHGAEITTVTRARVLYAWLHAYKCIYAHVYDSSKTINSLWLNKSTFNFTEKV